MTCWLLTVVEPWIAKPELSSLALLSMTGFPVGTKLLSLIIRLLNPFTKIILDNFFMATTFRPSGDSSELNSDLVMTLFGLPGLFEAYRVELNELSLMKHKT